MQMLSWLRPPATVPSMDGPLRPNEALDKAPLLTERQAPDNLVWQDDHLLFTSGSGILLVNDIHDGACEPEEILRFETGITAMAAADDGSLAVGLGIGGIAIVGGVHDGKTITSLGGGPLTCPTALCFADPDTLFVCVGSEIHAPEAWQRDLLERRTCGSVWRLDLSGTNPVCLATRLGFPNGVLLLGDDRIAVSEAWRYRILEFHASKRSVPRILLDDLPGCPGRLAPASDGGAWLAIFAPRRQLIEFALRGDAYRHWKKRKIDPGHRIAPTLRADTSSKEPMQEREVEATGIVTPWEPLRSYGLVIHLDSDFTPIASLHGRADGRRHGVTSCLEIRSELIVACRGDNLVVSADLSRA